MTAYIYLHGFASSPRSSKAMYLRDRFAEMDLDLQVLDLNQGDFTHLSLTRQIDQTINAFPNRETPVVLIGSSFGALTSAWVAQQQPQVEKLVLLAPAFGFPQSWYSRLQPEQIEQWRETNYLPIYHYGENRQIPLHYQFLKDAENYPLANLKRSLLDESLQRVTDPQRAASLATLIIHGINDDVVPVGVSRDFAKQHDLVELVELDSDHGLNDVQEEIWRMTSTFLNLSGND